MLRPRPAGARTWPLYVAGGDLGHRRRLQASVRGAHLVHGTAGLAALAVLPVSAVALLTITGPPYVAVLAADAP